MGIIERAYELARTGHYATRSKISRALEKEGFTLADGATLQGRAITDDLNRICRETRAEKAKGGG